MTTAWVRNNVEQAFDLAEATRYRSALEYLLPVLSVYPNQPDALRVASVLLYHGFNRKNAQDSAEPLTLRYVNDRRLDQLFCSCQWQGCTVTWVSLYFLSNVADMLAGFNPVGGRCTQCGRYSCRNHYVVNDNGTIVCPFCGGGLEGAPPPNGRRPGQTIRLNQPLVMFFLLHEGPLPIDQEYLQRFCELLAPDVLEDKPELYMAPMSTWPAEVENVASSMVTKMVAKELVTESNPASREEFERLAAEFLKSHDHDVHVEQGYDLEYEVRWCVAKVFAREPRYVDPDAGYEQDAGYEGFLRRR